LAGEEKQSTEEAQQKIERRAYEIWENEGCPHGRDLDHWLKAEAEITSSPSTAPAPSGEGQPTPATGKGKK
jgi:hypothetical protein